MARIHARGEQGRGEGLEPGLPESQGRAHLRRRRDARQVRHTGVLARAGDRFVEARGDRELRAGSTRLGHSLGGRHGAGPDDDVPSAGGLDDGGQRVDGLRGLHRHLDADDAEVPGGAGELDGPVGGIPAQDGHDRGAGEDGLEVEHGEGVPSGQRWTRSVRESRPSSERRAAPLPVAVHGHGERPALDGPVETRSRVGAVEETTEEPRDDAGRQRDLCRVI